MNILTTFHKYNVRQWILLRMSASEFGYKKPYDINEEYPIMTRILGLSLTPIFMIFGFLIARIYGSLERYDLPIIITMFIVCFGIAFLIIRFIKNTPFIDETISMYESMDLETRKKLSFLKNMIKLTIIMVGLPWLIFGTAVTLICIAVHHSLISCCRDSIITRDLYQILIDWFSFKTTFRHRLVSYTD